MKIRRNPSSTTETIGIIALFSAIGLGVYFYFNPGGKKKETTPSIPTTPTTPTQGFSKPIITELRNLDAQESVVPPTSLLIKEGNTVRVTFSYSYLGPAVSGNYYTAFGKQGVTFEETRSIKKSFSLSETTEATKYTDALDIIVSGASVATGDIFDLYVKITDILGSDQISSTYANAITITGSQRTETLAPVTLKIIVQDPDNMARAWLYPDKEFYEPGEIVYYGVDTGSLPRFEWWVWWDGNIHAGAYSGHLGGPNFFVVPSTSETITAVFKSSTEIPTVGKYKLTILGKYVTYAGTFDLDTGNFSVDPRKDLYAQGEEVYVGIVSTLGMNFEGWFWSDGEFITTSPTVLIVMMNNTTLIAKFTEKQVVSG